MSRGPAPLYLVYDGAALEVVLYQIVKRCPPMLDDFESYEVLQRRYDRRDYFLGIGVSAYRSRQRAEATARRFGRGRAVVAMDLRGKVVTWAQTGRSGDHVTVWAPSELLLESVLQCDEL